MTYEELLKSMNSEEVRYMQKSLECKVDLSLIINRMSDINGILVSDRDRMSDILDSYDIPEDDVSEILYYLYQATDYINVALLEARDVLAKKNIRKDAI